MSKTKKITIGVIITILILLAGAIVFIKYQNIKYQNSENSEIKTVQLSQLLDSKMVVYETDNYIITFGLNDFESNLNAFIEKNPDINDDKELLSFIKEEEKQGSQININNFSKQERVEFRLADLLETGKFSLFNKENNTYMTEIKIETYSDNCGPLCGSGGRRYIIPDGNLIFYEVTDWIS